MMRRRVRLLSLALLFLSILFASLSPNPTTTYDSGRRSGGIVGVNALGAPPCAAGEYYVDCNNECVACPAGSYCLGTFTPVVPCAVGTANGSPGGTSSAACVACSSGYYAAATGSTSCQPCPAGYRCPTVSSTPVQCTPGTYATALQTGCANCAAGTFSQAGASSCTTCAAGYYCPNVATTQQLPCARGFYSTPGSTSCTACPAGSACPSPDGTANYPCPSGSYSLSNFTSCTLCPAGSQCPSTSQLPSACSAGQYALAGSVSCTACPPGSACPLTTHGPTACPLGYYSLGSATACTQCPAGSACPLTSVAPVACLAGTYSLAGFTACVVCPPGMACPSTSALPSRCTPGTYAVGGETACQTCPAGSECPTIRAAIVNACRPGTYSAAGAARCTTCPAGSYCPSTTSTTPILCPAGSYSVAGQVSCTTCPRGFQCPQRDGTQNAPCLPGSYSVGNSTACTTCPAGNACPFTDQAVVTPCALGTYATAGSMQCTRCPPGYMCPDTTQATRVICALGTYQLNSSNVCNNCPAGYYCPYPDRVGPLQCPLGTFSPGGAVSACTVCPAGSYCPNITLSAAIPCPANTYSFGRATACTQCPDGYSCATPSLLPQPCPPGQYRNGVMLACANCAAGFWCPLGSPSAYQRICPSGTYCPAGSTTPINCPAGTYGNQTMGVSQAAACPTCPPSYACPTGVAALTPQYTCPRGSYCPGGNGAGTPCPAGTYNNQFGRTLLGDCLVCPAGFFCPAGTALPRPCPPGRYCPAGIGAAVSCDPGTYNPFWGQDSSTKCLTCLAGNYCPSPSVNPTPCVAGTYNPIPGQSLVSNCLPCASGYACTQTRMVAYTDSPCPPGYYCPLGSSNLYAQPCPGGTYSDRWAISSSSQCKICPRGFACAPGTGGLSQQPVPCTPGFYCPGAPTPGDVYTNYYGAFVGQTTTLPNDYPCPPGTYSNLPRLTAASECFLCPNGTFCVGGLTVPSGPCTAGYYCPQGSSIGASQPCPAGTFSARTDLFRADQCTPCPPGSYCTQAVSAPTQCPAGSYSSVNGTVSGVVGTDPAAMTCLQCPAGHYCPLGTSTPVPCGTGRYSAAGQTTTCPSCPVGQYCPIPTTTQTQMLANVCPAGMFCPGGVSRLPDFETYACPVGRYCTAGTLAPEWCPAGTYNPNVGRQSVDDCIGCPAGSYCTGGVNITGLCSPGYYCTGNSTTPTQIPCPQRYYRDLPGGESLEGCAVCPRGSYCLTSSVNPTPCPQGYFCSAGVYLPEPCPLGTFGNSTNLRAEEECTPCPAGRYCAGLGIPAPTGFCDPGYYCLERSFTSAPQVLPYGGLCPAGGYCPIGSSYPAPCPRGTYNNFTGGRDVLDCVTCPPGYYCEGSNKATPTGLCAGGYICPGGAQSPTGTTNSLPDNPVPVGYYSLAGAFAATPCPVGTYQPSVAQSGCLACPARYFCNSVGKSSAPDPCPAGKYCPEGTSTPLDCPRGTLGLVTLRANSSECDPCPPGMYCDSLGAQVATGPCAAGFYCLGGSATPTPALGPNGGPCPAGRYCPVQTSTPQVPCPVGTYSSVTGNAYASNCTRCTPGFYCDVVGLTSPAGPCAPGYYCIGGTTTPAPNSASDGGYICPSGRYCPGGNSYPLSCPAGSFQIDVGASACTVCPAGYYCPSNTTNPVVCPIGMFCPNGTGDTIPQCPAGTFGNTTGLTSASQCVLCSAGRFCSATGLSGPNGVCGAGYYCLSGAINSAGQTGSQGGQGGDCPAGSYCTALTSTPTPCGVGTYNPATRSTSSSACLPCTPGSYCAAPGLPAPTAVCAAGYYCTSGASVATPVGLASGDVCPPGYYCPLNSTTPLACPPGTYNNATGQTSCTGCPAGHYCPTATVDFRTYPCPAGYWCGTGQSNPTLNPCPVGTVGNTTGLSSSAQCSSCPPGHYCATVGLRAPTGPCSGGFYCTGGSSVSNPTSGTGGACTTGNYCPPGSVSMLTCAPGFYCGQPQLAAPNGNCSAGYFCLSGATVPNPTNIINGNQCPVGKYCPTGSAAPIDCPPGTYSNNVRNRMLSDCTVCPSGSYCTGPAATTISGACAAGHYCPPGQSSATAFVCPIGHYCPASQGSPTRCPSGQYQQLAAQSACVTCPQGFYCKMDDYCDSGNFTLPKPCPMGNYCPAGTQFPTQFPCPVGTFSNTTNNVASSQCNSCTQGYYCDQLGLSAPAGPCQAGYYCSGGATVSNPTNGVHGNICPQGNYCPTGSVSPTPCAPGKFSVTTGNINAGSCIDCSPGQYCASSGLSVSSSGPCDPGFVCLGGSWKARPINDTFGFICPPGTYCPSGSFAVRNCAPGTFNADYGQAACSLCPAGAYCPNSTMDRYIECPAGHYCPANSIQPTPCPAGTYNPTSGATNSTFCRQCDAGKFCQGTGLSTFTNNCGAGYFCSGGATTSAPVGVAPASNGPCPAGFYCTAGTTAPTPCGPGYFNPDVGAATSASCQLCTPGRYCNGTGLGVVSGLCAGGYYCPVGQTVPNPASFVCPPGHYCPPGSALPTGCLDGTFQNLPMSSTCNVCPAGSYCVNNSTQPIQCPAKHFCPPGTANPPFCPDGTYSSAVGLQNATDCTQCPVTQYCVAGDIVGNCSAGYICYFGNGVPNPPYNGETDPRGGLCPRGHYCPLATRLPVACQNGTFNPNYGSRQQTDCGPCPAGYQCVDGNPTPQPCPPGFYCPYLSPLQPCPAGTFNPFELARNASACIPCTEGYYCPQASMVDFRSFPCGGGYYCPTASRQPTPCKGGSYRAASLGRSQDDCTVCPAGYYCSNASIAVTICPAGTYCPVGSSVPLNCQGGTYCPAGSASANPCPAGYYCPTSTGTPIVCPQGSYCPAGSSIPLACPAGYYSPNINLNRTSIETSCFKCTAGTAGDDPQRQSCRQCLAGYVCLAGATTITPVTLETENGYECPPGYYCPAGSGEEIACPVATYGPYPRLTHPLNCTTCPANSYNHLTGQPACFPCGSSAYSLAGSTECICNGTNRAFQMSDGACICKAGYVFYDEQNRVSERDSAVDCSVQIYQACPYLNANGDCVVPEKACNVTCPSGGSFNPTTGFCDCNNAIDVDAICDASCRAAQPLIQVTSAGIVFIYNGTATTYPLTALGSGNVFNLNLNSTSPVQMMYAYPGGQRALLNVRGSYFNALMTQPGTTTNRTTRAVIEAPEFLNEPLPFERRVTIGARALLQSSNSTVQQTGPTGVDQSATCLLYGQTVLWDVSDSSRQHYPVYIKDSLYNSNPSFDYGAFRRLATQMQSGVSIQTFAFTFVQQGIYVFADNANRLLQTVIRVMPPGQTCPGSSQVNSLSTRTLTSLGVSKNSNIVLSPDYLLIGVLIIGLALLVLGVILGIYFFRRRRWGDGVAGEAGYRKLGYDYNVNSYDPVFAQQRELARQRKLEALGDGGSTKMGALSDHDIGFGEGVDHGVAPPPSALAAGAHPQTVAVVTKPGSTTKMFLEDFNVRTLFDKLQDQTILLMSQLSDFNTAAEDLYTRMKAETDEIRDLVAQRQALLGDLQVTDLPEGKTPEEVLETIQRENGMRDESDRIFDQDLIQVRATMEELENRATAVADVGMDASDSVNRCIADLDKQLRDMRVNQEEEAKRRLRVDRTLPDELGEKLATAVAEVDPAEMNARNELIEEYERSTGVLEELAKRLERAEVQRRGQITDDARAPRSSDVEDMAKNMLEELRDHRVHANAKQVPSKSTNRDATLRRNNARNLLVQFINKDKKPEIKLSEDNFRLLAREIDRILRELARREAAEAAHRGGGAGAPGMIFRTLGGDDHEPTYFTAGNEDDAARLMLNQDRERQLAEMSRRIEEREQDRLRRHGEEMQALEDTLDEEEDNARAELAKRLDDEQARRLRQLELDQETRRREAIHDGADDAEIRRMEQEFEDEKRDLEERMQDEQSRQRDLLESRLAKRRKNRVDRLQEDHDEENDEEHAADTDDRAQLERIMDLYSADKDDMDAEIARQRAEQMQRMQQRLANRRARRHDRHKKEVAALEDDMQQEEEEEQAALTSHLTTQLRDDLDRLDSDYQQKVQQAVRNGASEEELARLQRQYEEDRQRMLDRMRAEQRRQQESLAERMARKRAKAMKKLKKAHDEQDKVEEEKARNDLDEMARIMGTYDATRAGIDEKLERGRRKQLEALNQRLAERRNRRMQRQNDDLKNLEEALKVEEEAAGKNLAEHLKEDEEEALRMLEEKYNEDRLAALRAGDADELERLKRQYEEEQERIRQRTKAETQRQKAALEERLARRRQKRRDEMVQQHVDENHQEEEDGLIDMHAVQRIFEQYSGDTDMLTRKLTEEMQRQQERLRKRLADKDEKRKREQELEQQEMRQQLAAEEAVLASSVNDRLTQEIGHKEDVLDAKYERAIEQARQRNDDDEVRRLTEAYEADKSRLASHMEDIRQQQMARVQARLARQAREREARLKQKHGAELTEDIHEKMMDVREMMSTFDNAQATDDENGNVAQLKRQLEEQEKRIRELEENASSLVKTHQDQLTQELAAKEREMEMRMQAALNQRAHELEANRSALESRMKEELALADTEEERERIKRAFEELEALHNERARREHSKQQELFEKKLKKLQQEKERRQKQKEQEALLKLMEEKNGMLDDALHASTAEAATVTPAIAGGLINDQVANAIGESQQRKKEEIQRRIELEQREELARLERELQMERDKQRVALEREEGQRLAQRQQEIEARKYQEQSEAATEEERSRIAAQYEEENQAILEGLRRQRERQSAQMERELERRKRERALKIKQRKDEERERALAAEMEAERAQMKRMEEEALQNAVLSGEVANEAEKRSTIELTLRKRHEREYAELVERQEEEKARVLERALEAARHAHLNDRDDLVEKQVEVETTLRRMVEENQTDPAEIERTRAQHARELQEFEQAFQESVPSIREAALADLQVAHMKARVDMKKAQLEEIAKVCDEMTPEVQLMRLQEAQQRKMKEEMDELRRQLEREREEQERRLAEERERLRIESERERADLMRKLEEEERVRAAALEEKLNAERERQEREREEAAQRAAAAAAASASSDADHHEETTRIIDAASAEADLLQRRFAAECDTQKARFMARMKEMQDAKKARVEAEFRRQQEEQKRAEQELAAKNEAQKKQEASQVAKKAPARFLNVVKSVQQQGVPPTPTSRSGGEEGVRMELPSTASFVAGSPAAANLGSSATRAGASPRLPGATPPVMNEEAQRAWMDMIMRSPLFAKLKQVESLVLSLSDRNFSYQQVGTRLSSMDRSMQREGKLVEVPAPELSVPELVVYKFARFATSLFFASPADAPNVCIASSLPAVDYRGNVFRNSYHFEPATNTLFVRRERFQSVGDLCLILAHASAHLAAKDGMHDDMSNAFIQHFYDNVRRLSQELFARTANAPRMDEELMRRLQQAQQLPAASRQQLAEQLVAGSGHRSLQPLLRPDAAHADPLSVLHSLSSI